jgi:hypothetical protein
VAQVNVVPQSLFAWHRVRLANLLAHSAPEWAAVFSQYNSGTYNNQYPVINVGAFQPGKALPDDLLWVVEQIPGTVVAGDATELLALGHFPSCKLRREPPRAPATTPKKQTPTPTTP